MKLTFLTVKLLSTCKNFISDMFCFLFRTGNLLEISHTVGFVLFQLSKKACEHTDVN